MKNSLLKWIGKCKVALYVSIGYGLLGTSLYLVSCFTGPDDAAGAWVILYYASRPISWAINQVTARLENWLPESVNTFLYASEGIVSGMLMSYVVVRTLIFIITKFKGRGPA